MIVPAHARSVPLAVFAMTLLLPSICAAQIDKTVGLGGGVAFYHGTDELAHNSEGFAFVYWFGKPEGWRPTFAFNWFRVDFDAHVGSERVTLGELRLRPIMGGYGHTWRFGRLAATASGVGGYSFNSFDTDDAARLAYRRHLDATLLSVSASDSFAGRGEVSVWYDLNTRFGVVASAGYIFARPGITITSDIDSEKRRLHADSVKFQFGVAYGIF